MENLLLNFRAVWNETQTPFCSKPIQTETVPTNACSGVSPLDTPSTKAKKRNEFAESRKCSRNYIRKIVAGTRFYSSERLFISVLPDLIKLVHGNKINAHKLSEEFQAYALSQECSFHMSKTCIQNKIKDISSWWPQKACWYVLGVSSKTRRAPIYRG